jgi:hypothetical protein
MFWIFIPNSSSTNCLSRLVKLLMVVPLVKRFYFVVPTGNFEDFKKQPHFTKKLHVAKRLPKSVAGVE